MGTIFCVVSFFLAAWLSFFGEPIYGAYRSMIIIGLSAAFIFSIFSNRKNIKFYFLPSVEVPLLIYLIIIGAGIVFIANKQIALNRYWGFIFPSIILYYLFKNQFLLVANKRRFLSTIIIMSSLVSIIAIFEFVYRKNVIYESHFFNLYYRNYLFQRRAMSTQFVSPVLGTYLAACIPAAYYFIFEKNIKLKVLGIICGILMITGLLLSGQRSSFVGWIIATAIYLFIRNKKIFLIFLFSTVLLFSATAFNKNVYLLGRYTLAGLTEKPAYAFRIVRFNTAIKMINKHPFLGLGLEQYKVFFSQFDSENINYYKKTPDNMYLMILCESGVVVFGAFIIFIWALLKKALLYVKAKRNNFEIVLSLLAGFITMLFSMLTYDALYWTVPFYLYWIYSGMIASLISVPKNNLKESSVLL